MMIVVREATIDDADKKGYVHYQTWQQTYTGLINQEYLDNMTIEKCIDIARKYPNNTLAAVKDNELIGFACYGQCRDAGMEDYGEIMAIYILQSQQRQGVGKLLLDSCYKKLFHYKKISLWVLSTNINAINFYKKHGFTFSGEEKQIVLGAPVIVLRMVKENDCL